MQTPLGPIVTADEVCQAVQATLQAWMPALLIAMGSDLDAPHDYEQVPTVDALIAADLPAVGIASPGWAGRPVRDEDGNYRVTWRVNVVAFIRGDSYQQTQANTRTYAAAIATILMQQRTLLGFAVDTTVAGEGYEPINDGGRTLGGALIEVDVTVDDARNDLAVVDGPPDDSLTYAVTAVGVDVSPEE